MAEHLPRADKAFDFEDKATQTPFLNHPQPAGIYVFYRYFAALKQDYGI
jgi:hypothetical protein